LKEYEYTIRQEIVTSFSSGNTQIQIEESVYLPFNKLLHYNEKILDQIKNGNTSLSNISTDEDFLKHSKDLLLNLESLFFFTKIQENENEVIFFLLSVLTAKVSMTAQNLDELNLSTISEESL